MKRALVSASALLLLALALAAWVESRRARPVALTPTLTGQPEYCLTCHDRASVPEISPSHPVKAFGCVVCHGGERLALDAALAHSTLRGGRNPSDLSVVEASCGGSACHSGAASDQRDHIQRVQTSVQATYAGAIAQIRYAFGAQPDLQARLGVVAIADPEITTGTGLPALDAFDPAQETSPAVQKFAQNCLNCHLSAEPRSGPQYTRFTGCAACHTPVAGTGVQLTGAGGQVNAPAQPIHRLTTAIPYSQCNACHNRGNYDLRNLQFNPRADEAGRSAESPYDRLHDYYQPIAQFTQCEYELDCVDCHTTGEAMGDGDIHSNKAEAQYIQCRTCHGTLAEPPLTRTIGDANDLALRLAFLNSVIDLQVGDAIVVTEKGEPIWNMRQRPDGAFELAGKVTGARYTVPLVANSQCKQKPDQQESRYCHECHAVQR